MIAIVDYGMGNLASIKNMLKKLGVPSEITSSPSVLEKAEKIILPGVGAFDNAMINIRNFGLIDILTNKALKEKVPILGICLGMQVLMSSSEEGQESGLGWIEGKSLRFRFSDSNPQLKVPHMGWNRVYPKDTTSLYKNIVDPRFYFVHSFYVKCQRPEDSLAKTSYGFDFDSSIHKENIYGTQFHPEKSHKFGMQLLKNFVEIV